MDRAYITQLWIVGVGGIVGLFVSARIVGILAAALLAIAVVGLVVAIAMEHKNLTWLFGLSAMALPIVGSAAFIGALVGEAVRRAIRRRLGK